ncbi:Crp/Fnr family transcriptional regulator [Pseudomonas fluorescens]|uniref:Crp/Fnr family transcriptional regulator n=1 Tax=Pseudomonas fluorescens TaxID=294 RepID=UPI00113022F9|nr:Crp/Fnr family transcriptional regulator [Pseudomonas fluorescens]TMU71879.1 Crp/Fnr family transcriptional regulator [Pseudomonas fluorescens]
MKLDTVLGDFFLTFGKDLHIEANHALLRSGDFAKNLYLIKAGAVRICVRDPEGMDISVQFFFEGEVVSSLESLVSGCPSELEIITMEACHLCVLDRDTVLAQILSKPILQTQLLALTQLRLADYIKLYTSAISQTPTERYLGMLSTQSDRLARIPMHVLAGYLGVTPVHLSRIRRKLKASADKTGI